MRHFIGQMFFLAWFGSASALTPPPDISASFFSGEWAGTGERGSYCYLNLGADGWGILLIDGGSHYWLGARVRWSNRQQMLQLEAVIPLAISTQRNIMPLETFVIRSESNQSLSVTWNTQSPDFHLQKIETTTRHLNRARDMIEELLRVKGVEEDMGK